MAKNQEITNLEIIGDYKRTTIDHIFSLQQKTYEYDVSVHHEFIDFIQAYDSINRPQLLKSIGESGIPNKLIGLVEMTLKHTACHVKVVGASSVVFKIFLGYLDKVTPFQQSYLT